MGSASKYDCTAFKLEREWEHSPYSTGDHVLHMDQIATLKGYNHTTGTYSVQYPDVACLFEAPACEVQPASTKRPAPENSPPAPKRAKKRTTLEARMEDRMAAMEQDHASKLAEMKNHMAAMAKDHEKTKATLAQLQLTIDRLCHE